MNTQNVTSLLSQAQPSSKHLTYAEADLRMWRANSFNRMKILLDYFPKTSQHRRKLTNPDWVLLLGNHWISCDRIGEYTEVLREIMPHSPIRLMMTPEENKAYDELPPLVRIYRGAGASLPLGPCWSLSKDVALGYPGKTRSWSDNPVLYHGYVRKSCISAVKLGRGEQEIITFRAQVVKIERLGANRG